VIGCGGLESTQHMFIFCPVFTPWWNSIRSWIDISSAGPDKLQDHFVQFIHSSGGLRVCRSFLQLAWLSCYAAFLLFGISEISRIFKTKKITIHHIVDKVKLYSVWWLKAWNVNIGLNTHMRWSSPFVCIDIDRNFCF
jgi:hypothetical protein